MTRPLTDGRLEVLALEIGLTRRHAGAPATREEERAMAQEIIRLRARLHVISKVLEEEKIAEYTD